MIMTDLLVESKLQNPNFEIRNLWRFASFLLGDEIVSHFGFRASNLAADSQLSVSVQFAIPKPIKKTI